ncbi:MAG TPA: universal stress protein [Syntrophorhabdaceae bacterium]|nr:universal stress protein [Syntrophorhabdaceae bacterium]
MFTPKRILVPTDFSAYSDKALEQAIDLSKQYKSTIYLIHVVDIIRQCSMDYCMDPRTLEILEKDSMAMAERMLKEQVDRIPESKSVDIKRDIRKGGPPSEEILRIQAANQIDLIVIASHGKTGLLHHLIGSVAEKVTRGAKCPVLLVRA